MPPLRLAVLVGEIIHNLRSAIDHLLWQLVVANGQEPGERHQFPVYDDKSKYKAAVKRKRITGISAAAEALVQGLQPYHAVDPTHDPLWLLHNLHIRDKHCLLPFVICCPTVTRVTMTSDQGRYDQIGGTSAFRGTHGGWMTEETPIGSVEFSTPVTNVGLEGEFKIEIAFANAWGLEYRPIVQGLRELSDAVVRIVNMFSDEFPEREPSISSSEGS